MQQLESSPAVKSADYYTEAHRPQFHFSPEANWMNDPNGMVYYDGEYHLFYQYYPDGDVWGPMHWGHAVSPDMVNWEHLPIALYPDKYGYIFSGSAVVDKQNTTGFKTGEHDPLVAIFTYHDTTGQRAGKNDFQTQGIAYSNDRGRTWTKYEGNPVIPNPGLRDFRDPKVSWHEESQQWVMIFARGDRVQIYNSPNLKDWTLASEFGEEQGTHGGVWECPDLFQLPIEGSNGQSKWVMLVSLNPGGANGGSGTMYFVGEFDGKTFINDNSAETVLWLDYGRDNYAGVSWSDIPKEDGRRLFMGWMSNWQYATRVPTSPWRSAMTIPRVLSLSSTDQGLRVKTSPVKELNTLRGISTDLAERMIAGSMDLSDEFEFDISTSEMNLEWDLSGSTATEVGIELTNAKGQSVAIGYDKARNEFYFDRANAGKVDFSDKFAGKFPAPNPSNASSIQMKMYIDVASVELFAQDGAVVMTDIFFPDEPFEQINFFANDGEAKLVSGQVWQLKRAW
ncbi:MAG: glycoside hydrolase family 32 protein [Bacteroidota bacterium]